MYDEKLGLHLGYGSYTIVLNIDCPKDKIPKELETFFAYVEKREIAKNLKIPDIPSDVIAKNTGLSIHEIEEL